MFKKFIDLQKQLQCGVEFYAVGLVDSPEPFVATGTGRDIMVTYIDPWGDVNHEWRDLRHLETSDINNNDAALLRLRYNSYD